MKNSNLMVTEIMGKKVKSKDGEEVGVVQNIMINPEDATIVYIILCYADFIGKIHRHFVIPNEMVILKRDKEKSLFFEVEQQELSNVHRLTMEHKDPFNKKWQRIYEIDQDAAQFSYFNFL